MARIITTGTKGTQIPTQPRSTGGVVSSGNLPQPALPAAPQPVPTQPQAAAPVAAVSPLTSIDLGGPNVTGALPLSNLARGAATVGAQLRWNGTLWLPSFKDLNDAQTDWYIDPVGGNDANPGSSSAPIASFGEFLRRTGSASLRTNPPITHLSIHWLNDQSALDDPITLQQMMHGVPFTMDGALIEVGSGTFGAVTNVGVRTDGVVTTAFNADGTVPTNYWTQFYGMLVHDTTNDTWFRVDRDLGNRKAQFTRPFTGVPVSPAVGLNALGTIGAGHNFVVYRFPQVYMGSVGLLFYSSQISDLITFRHLHFLSPGEFGVMEVMLNTNISFFAECLFDGFVYLKNLPEQSVVYNCYFTGGCGAFGVTINGGGVDPFLSQGESTSVDGDCIVHGGSEIWGECACGLAYFDGTMDVSFSSLQAPYRGILALSNGGSLYGQAAIWGPAAVHVHSNGQLVYDGTAVAQLLHTGGMTLSGLTTGAKVTPGSPRIITDGINVTPTNIDDTTGGKAAGMQSSGADAAYIFPFR